MERHLGTPYLLIKVAVRELSPPLWSSPRTLPAAILLIPLALRRGHLRPLLRHWRWIVAYTVVELALPWLFSVRSRAPPHELDGGAPDRHGPLIAVVIYRVLSPSTEHITRRRLLGLVIGFAGVGALVGIDLHRHEPRRRGRNRPYRRWVTRSVPSSSAAVFRTSRASEW